MNNYDDIALEAIKKCIPAVYDIAIEAARLQSEKFHKDLEQSYIDSLTKEDLGL